MKRLVLLEDYPKGFDVGPGDLVISLTPQASYRLDQQHQPYRIPPDFGVEDQLKEREDAYWQEELLWFDELDAMLQERLPELTTRAIRPSILYGHYLKCVLDNLFIRGLESLTLLEQGEVSQVVLWAGPATSAASPPQRGALRLEQAGVYPRLWRHLCATRGIPYEEMASPALPPSFPNGHAASAFRGAMAATIQQVLGLCREWQWVIQACGGRAHASKRRLTLLLLETNDDLTALLEAALRHGHRCLVRRCGRIIDPARPGWSVQLSERVVSDTEAMAGRWAAAAEDMFAPASPIWRWPDGWFGCSMASLLADWFKSWLSSELLQVIPLSDRFHRLYQTERVDMVLTPALLDRFHIAAVAAGERPQSAHTALVAHGSGPDVAASWDLFELFPYHHYFVPDEEFAEYFRQRRTLYRRSTAQVHVGSYRWDRYTRLARRPRVYLERSAGLVPFRIGRPPLNLPATRPVIVYVIGRPEVAVRYLNKPEYSETWYYRLQTALIRLFADTPDYTFVMKLFPTQDPATSAVGRFIRDLHAPHLYVSTSPLSRWLPWADRVIMDIPSTPLYETTLAKVPFHMLVHRSATMRPTALAQFAYALTVFDGPEEAVRAVRSYLQSPLSPQPPFRPDDMNDILSTLCSLVGEQDTLSLWPVHKQPATLPVLARAANREGTSDGVR